MRPIDDHTEELLRQLLLQADRDTSTWWAEYVVSLIVGIATIGLAAASVYVAAKSSATAMRSAEIAERTTIAAEEANRLARDIHEAGIQLGEHKARRAHAGQFGYWYWEWITKATEGTLDIDELQSSYGPFLAEAVAFGDENILVIHNHLLTAIKDAKGWIAIDDDVLGPSSPLVVTSVLMQLNHWADGGAGSFPDDRPTGDAAK